MDAHERLVTRIADEQDDILGTIQLIDEDRQLQDRLFEVGSSRVDLQACKLEYSIVSPK